MAAMSETATNKILDLTRDLRAAARLGTSTERVDELLGQALDTLGRLVPFDLATVMELDGAELRVRVARGELADDRVAQHRLRLEDFPSIRRLLEAQRARAFTEVDHRDGDGDAFDGVLDLPQGHSCMVVPLRGGTAPQGIMTFDRQSCGSYPDEVVELADVFGRLLAMAMTYGEQSVLLGRLREQLEEQNRVLRERVGGRMDAGRLMDASRAPVMVRLVELAHQVAGTDTPVLVTGETGTGKEVLANALHSWSKRAGHPLVSLNCAALPPTLIESELFGHVKGAFSGATARRIGRFQAANGGTLFLDEVAELPIGLQAKLLRVLQDGCFEPVGSDRSVRVDVRLIAATNADLLQTVAEQRFRQDLYYRLAVFPIHLPPLRERREDIAVIADNVLESLSRRTGRGPWRLPARSRRWLEQQPWPGNVRELVNTLERATILAVGPELPLEMEAVQAPSFPAPASGGATGEDSNAEQGCGAADDDGEPLATLEEMERRHILRALGQTGGKLYGADGAAALLGINPNTLRSRMKKLGLGGVRSMRVKG